MCLVLRSFFVVLFFGEGFCLFGIFFKVFFFLAEKRKTPAICSMPQQKNLKQHQSSIVQVGNPRWALERS